MDKIALLYRGISIAIFVEQCDSRCYLMTEIDGSFTDGVAEASPSLRGLAVHSAIRIARSNIDKARARVRAAFRR